LYLAPLLESVSQDVTDAPHRRVIDQPVDSAEFRRDLLYATSVRLLVCDVEDVSRGLTAGLHDFLTYLPDFGLTIQRRYNGALPRKLTSDSRPDTLCRACHDVDATF
jgi:hypothetical protein